MTSSNYADDGTRLTDCCAAYSTFHDDVLCCKVCWNEVSVGEGDGSDSLESIQADFDKLEAKYGHQTHSEFMADFVAKLKSKKENL